MVACRQEQWRHLTDLSWCDIFRGRSDANDPTLAELRSCPAGGRRHVRSLHSEQFTRPQVGVKSNEHKHGEPDKLVESKLLGHPAQATEGHRISSELSCPHRPPAKRPGCAWKFVLAVAILIAAVVQIPIEAIPALCGSLRLKEQIREVSGHSDVDQGKRRKGKLPPLAPTLEDNDGSQVHTGSGISDCESPKVPRGCASDQT